MNFTQYNKNTFEKIEWTKKTDGFKFKKLGDFFKAGQKIVTVYGFFFTKSENYGLQPIAIGDADLINLPTHKKDIISDMLKNPDCVQAIKNGECSLKIREYKSKYNKVCYDIDFVNTPTTNTETTETTETTEKKPDDEKQADIF